MQTFLAMTKPTRGNKFAGITGGTCILASSTGWGELANDVLLV
jgi:hypothetical protein